MKFLAPAIKLLVSLLLVTGLVFLMLFVGITFARTISPGICQHTWVPCVDNSLPGTNTSVVESGVQECLHDLQIVFWEDLNGNGREDEAEPRFPGILVTLVQRDDGTEIGTRRTDFNGLAVFEDLPAGQYKLLYKKPEAYVFTRRDTVVDLSDCQPMSDQVATEEVAGLISSIPQPVEEQTISDVTTAAPSNGSNATNTPFSSSTSSPTSLVTKTSTITAVPPTKTPNIVETLAPDLTDTPTITRTPPFTTTPVQHRLDILTGVDCEGWVVQATTIPLADLSYNPASSGQWHESSFVRVEIIAQWPEGAIKMEMAVLYKPNDCYTITPTSGAIPAATNAPSPTTTATNTPTPTATSTPSPTATATASATVTATPTFTPSPSPTPPIDYTLELETIITCDSWQVLAITEPAGAEIVFIPTNEGNFEMRDVYRVIANARWPNGMVESRTVEIVKPDNCDLEPTPTPTAEPGDYVLELFSEVTCDSWLVWAETTPYTDQLLILPRSSGTFAIRREFTIEARAYWPANISQTETIDIQEPEGCENDTPSTEPPPRADTMKALHNPQEQKNARGKRESADKP